MWVLKIQFENKENILNKLANKHNITLFGYPLNSFSKNNSFYLNAAGNIIGTEHNKKELFRDLKTSREITHLERKNDFMIIQISQPPSVLKIYSPELIYIDPIKITNNFIQEYHIASWNRKLLSDIINLKAKNVKSKVLKFKKEKVKNISIKKMSPDLTKKQQFAFDIAFKNEYYEFPRHTGLSNLCKQMNVSISTYHAHLRKAERKIMRFFFKFSK